MQLAALHAQAVNEAGRFRLGTFVSVHLNAGWWILEKELGEPTLTIPVNYFLWEAPALQVCNDPLDALEFIEKWGRPFHMGATDLSESEQVFAHTEAVSEKLIPASAKSIEMAREWATSELLESTALLNKHGLAGIEFDDLLLRVFSPQEVIIRLQTMVQMSVAARSMFELNELNDDHALETINNQLSTYAPVLELSNAPNAKQPNICTEMALQIFQVHAQGVPLKTCQNASCAREFIFQRGRSTSRTHRSTGSTRFCSHKCAKTQTQRTRRMNQ
jgi:hypothetical protein